MDQVESPETALTEIKYNLLAGLGMQEYASFLKDVKDWHHGQKLEGIEGEDTRRS